MFLFLTSFRSQLVVPWWMQFYILFHRTMKENWRKRVIFLIQIVQTVIMAVLTGTVYLKVCIVFALLSHYQMPLDQSYVNTRQSSLFFSCVNQGIFSALITINSFPSERVLSLRERAAGMIEALEFPFCGLLMLRYLQCVSLLLGETAGRGNRAIDLPCCLESDCLLPDWLPGALLIHFDWFFLAHSLS